jgi:hypothetical protein
VANALEKYQKMMTAHEGAPLSNSIIGLLGAPSSGKSTLACTVSDKCPEELPAKSLTELDDVAYIGIEDGGLDSLTSLRLRVPPKNVVPYAAILADTKHPIVAFDMAVDIAISTGATKLVVDSISQLDVLLQGWLNTPAGKLEWSGDKFAMFRYSLGSHQVSLAKFKTFQGLKIAIFTPQAVLEDLDTKGQEKSASALAMDQKIARQDKAQGSIAQADLILGLTGKARELWTRDMSLLLGLVQEKSGSEYTRKVYTKFSDKIGLATKSRFEGLLPAVLEKNHLGHAIRTIRSFV